jgi:hypothetical protein
VKSVDSNSAVAKDKCTKLIKISTLDFVVSSEGLYNMFG